MSEISGEDAISRLAEATSGEIGNRFLSALVENMHKVMRVKLALITEGIGDPFSRARAIYCWKNGEPKDDIEYDLAGTPCELVYKGQRLVVPHALWQRFPKEKGFESYCGIPLHDDAGRVVGHFAIFSDDAITETKHIEGLMRIFALRVEAELQRLSREAEREQLIGQLNRAVERLDRQHKATRQANEFKSELLGIVAHDLRGPLTAIIGHAELIERVLDILGEEADISPEKQAAPRIKKSCGKIVETGDRMEKMISEMLQTARRDATSISLDCSSTDIADPVKTAIELNDGAAKRKNISVECDFGKDTVIVADEDRLVEITDNLLSNALKYSPAGSVVTVRTQIDDGDKMAVIEVADQGQGMNEYDLAEAFRRFHRLSAKPTAGESSTGLGLAIVKAIAEAHGGYVDVTSPGKDKGSTFTVHLPLNGPNA